MSDMFRVIHDMLDQDVNGGDKVVKEMRPISGKKAAKYREAMVHIDDLKPGDKVQWKGREYQIQRFPDAEEEVEVFRVLGYTLQNGESGSIYEAQENDFTVLYNDPDGDIVEYAYDSRRFEKV